MAVSIPVAVLGATGLVGQRLVARLSAHPEFDLACVTASDDRAGDRYGESVTWRIDEHLPEAAAALPLERTDASLVADQASVVLSALPSGVAAEVEPALAEAGALVCSNASVDRMAPDVPLIIPEINAEHLDLIDDQRNARDWSGALVKNPNCMSTTVSLPLSGLRRFGLESARMVTMQAISGAGTAGVNGVDIVDNVLPSIPGEADKLASEPRKLFGDLKGGTIELDPLTVEADCHRVPVVDGHLATVFAELTEAPTAEEAAAAMAGIDQVSHPTAPTTPVTVVDEPRRPQPRYDRDRADGMAVTVGPVSATSTGVRFTCLAHNTVRGAAGACLLAAEAAVAAGYGP